MDRYQVDWVGAAGAALSVLVALFIARRIVGEMRGPVFYLLLAVMTFVFSLGLRTLLRYIGV
jgi:hypothetical protein